MHSFFAKKLEPDLFKLKSFVRPLFHIAVSCVMFYALIDHGVIRWLIAFVYFFSMFTREYNKIIIIFPKVDRFVPWKRHTKGK